MLTKESAELLKGATGATDEQLAKLHGGEAKLFNNVMKMMQIQTVAEVVKSERCFAQVKVGDKLVFDPFLNPEKSTGIMCPKALLPVMSQIGALWEMAAEWAESGKEKPPEIIWRYIRCLDPGLEDGGLGGVVYNLRFEPKS
jgi:hypothetical protein